MIVDEAHIEIKGRNNVERVPDRFLDPDWVIAEGTAAEAGEKGPLTAHRPCEYNVERQAERAKTARQKELRLAKKATDACEQCACRAAAIAKPK